MKKYRVLSLLLAVSLLWGMATSVFATEDSTGSLSVTEEVTELYVTPEDGDYVTLQDYRIASDFEVEAKAAALLELNSNTLVYGYEMDRMVYPASLTKLMTCMLAIENSNMDDIVTVSATALENLSIYGSTANLQEGEQLPMEELLYCIMVSSANEGCNVIAEHISGDVESFVALMNQRAQELGMTATHFANTHGLHSDDHFTTVRDLLILARWAWGNEQFRKFASASAHTVPATNKSESRTLITTNYLISSQVTSKYYYPNATGIKTGFTTPAGGCLISSATNGKLTYLSIVCGCETLVDYDGTDLELRFSETKRMFEYGFDNFTYVQVLARVAQHQEVPVANAVGRSSVLVRPAENISVLLPESFDPAEDVELIWELDSQELTAPLEKEEVVGTVTAVYNGVALASCDLVTLTVVEGVEQEPEETPGPVEEIVGEAVEEAGDPEVSFWDRLMDYWYLTIPIFALLALICVLFMIRTINVRRAKKRARRRREAMRDRHER